jgi:hypothetical protein
MNPEKRELLAEHETLAVFDGVKFRPCRALTSLCPDRCGHAGDFAQFTIRKYLKYAKHGEYGDPEQKTFSVQVGDSTRKAIGDPTIRRRIMELEPGELVLLSWRHEYITREDASFPTRPIGELKKIDPEHARELLQSD